MGSRDLVLKQCSRKNTITIQIPLVDTDKQMCFLIGRVVLSFLINGSPFF